MINSVREERYLLIALGNPLRGDDAVAHQVADHVCTNTGCNIEVLKRATLDIGDLPVLKTYRPTVVFIIDAHRRSNNDKGFVIESGHDINYEKGFSHHNIHPDEYFHMATFWGCKPTIYRILISGSSFNHSDEISPYAMENAKAAIKALLTIIQKRC